MRSFLDKKFYWEIMFNFSMHDLHTLCPLNSTISSRESQNMHAGAYLRRTILSPSVKISRELSLSIRLNALRSSLGSTNRPASSMGLTIPADFITHTPFSMFYNIILPATTIYQKIPKKSMNFEIKSRTYFRDFHNIL